MAPPSSFVPHPPPANFTGTIHFPGAYAYFQDPAGDWALLQMDSPFSGVLNFTMAAQTAARLSNSYAENDPVTFHGVLVSLSYNGSPLQVFFLC